MPDIVVSSALVKLEILQSSRIGFDRRAVKRALSKYFETSIPRILLLTSLMHKCIEWNVRLTMLSKPGYQLSLVAS